MLIESVQRVWSESCASPDDTETGFQNHISAGIQSVIGGEYDLEYSGPNFTYYNSIDAIYRFTRMFSHFFSQNSSAATLQGNYAEDCIAQSRNFINGLKRGFDKKLHDAIEDIYSKCRNCGFAEIVLRSYLRLLEDKKKSMEEPERALENLRLIEEEVSAIN